VVPRITSDGTQPASNLRNHEGSTLLRLSSVPGNFAPRLLWLRWALCLAKVQLALCLVSDIPEASDEQLRRARRVGRPATGNAKQLIAIRIAPRLLAQLRRLAAKQSKPYQTLIHELLERAAEKKVA
jgi:uncharacterized protein (DUF4415 family)